MRIGVLGTGVVGRTLAAAFAGLGHEVVVGTRDPDATLRRGADRDGESVAAWHDRHDDVRLASMTEAVAGADLVVNALPGVVAVDAIPALGPAHLDGTVLLDVSNPLDFSEGFPPTLAVCNDDSVGERLQRVLPRARVVKSLNTMAAAVMVDPVAVAGGRHTVFVSGEDDAAKATVTGLLRDLGWVDVVDLGGIETSRGVEMWLPLWLRVMGVVEGPFQLRIVR